jgi:hypothetical protein
MIVKTPEERDAAIKAVESWLWHQGELPLHGEIATCIAWWVECWDREKADGMDTLASMYADHLCELVKELKGI